MHKNPIEITMKCSLKYFYGIVHLCLLCRNLLLSLLAACGFAASEESIEKTQPGASFA